MSKGPKMPKAVEDAEKRANELWEQEYGDKTGKTVKSATDGNIEALDDETPSDAKPDETPKPEGEPKATPEPEPTPEPAPKPKEEPTPTPAPGEDYEHKFNVLQGKYNSEVPALAYELAKSNQRIKELETRLESKPKEEPRFEPKVDLESNEKIKAFKTEYPDVFEAAQVIANAIIDQRLSKIDEKISKVEKNVGSVTESFGQTERERFKADLDKDQDVGKEWRSMNKNPEFINSLQTKDIYSGKTKHELLTDAWNRMDKEATLQFFKDHKAAKSSKPAQKSKGSDVDPKKIDPPKGGSGGPNIDTTEKNQPVITPADLTEFYQSVANGDYRGREAEAEKEELRLLKAIGVLKKK